MIREGAVEKEAVTNSVAPFVSVDFVDDSSNHRRPRGTQNKLLSVPMELRVSHTNDRPNKLRGFFGPPDEVNGEFPYDRQARYITEIQELVL